MSTKQKPAPQQTSPKVEWLNLGDLLIEEGFNPRTKKSFEKNTKELAEMISATGFIDPSIHCIQFIERDGKKYIRNGFTLHAAAKVNGMKQVPAIKTSMDATQELINLVTSNAGHPLTPYEQGEVYIRLRDGTDPKALKVGEEGRPDMKPVEIAKHVGYTLTHVCNCIAIREASPEIREMLLAGTINANAFTAAKANVEDSDKVLKILNAAVKQAKEDGKECATDLHVKKVKAQFVEPKLKGGKTKDTPPETFKKDKDAPEPAKSMDEIGGNEPPATQVTLELPAEALKEAKKNSRETIIAIIEEWEKGKGSPATLADKILASLSDLDVLPF
jgi:hypothetical protein